MESGSTKFVESCEFIRQNLPSWNLIADSEMKFELLPGLTNQVFKVTCSNPNITPNIIILRKFSENAHIVDRPRERKIFKELAATGNGPKCIADNEKYRIEEYIHSRTLYGPDYNKIDIRRGIARVLANFHKLDIPWVERALYLPDDLGNVAKCQEFERKCELDIYSEAEKEIINKIKQITSKEEKEWVSKIIPSDDIVLSHNDLSYGNQLLRDDNGEIMLIDLEYCGKNFRGFDIGYMYQEAIFISSDQPPYFKVDENNFPTDDDLRDFIRYYIVFSDMDQEEQDKIGKSLMNDEQIFQDYLKQKYDQEELNTRVEKLLREVKVGTLVCCHYIVTWSIKMYKTVNNNFDYFAYACQGYERYMKHKEELLKNI